MELNEAVGLIKKKSDADCIVYCGAVSRDGYNHLTKECGLSGGQRAKEVILFLATYGGDPDAAFRMARALRHYYEKLTVVVPSYCKSAGTLLVVGADELVIGDGGELGPLDIQLKKPDELFEMSSGLEISQAFSFLKEQSIAIFRSTLYDLKLNGQLTTKIASDIATKISTGLVSPIYAQIDPYKIGESQRAIAIAYAYGERLNNKSKNLKEGALRRLVTDYPSHSFVIDRKEASTLFIRVRQPSQLEQHVIDKIYNLCTDPGGNPFVLRLTSKGESSDDDQQPGIDSGEAPSGEEGAGTQHDRQSVGDEPDHERLGKSADRDSAKDAGSDSEIA